MNQKLTYIGLLMYAACYALLFGTWSAIVFGKVQNADQIVTYIQITLGALTGHVLTMLNPGRAGGSLSAPTQGGFAHIGMLLVLSALGTAAMLAGCATSATRETPQQLAAQVCPAVQVTLNSLTALEGLAPPARADLAQIGPVVAAACAPGAAVDTSSLQALASTAMPAMQRIINAAGLPAISPPIFSCLQGNIYFID